MQFVPSILQRERGWFGFSVAIVCCVLLCLLPPPALPRSVPGVKALLALANARTLPAGVVLTLLRGSHVMALDLNIDLAILEFSQLQKLAEQKDIPNSCDLARPDLVATMDR